MSEQCKYQGECIRAKHLLDLQKSVVDNRSGAMGVGKSRGVSGRQPGEKRDIQRHSDRVNKGTGVVSFGRQDSQRKGLSSNLLQTTEHQYLHSVMKDIGLG